jgi:hypothetical protein
MDKKVAEIVQQGGVGVWRAKGSDTNIYAVSAEQAQQEAQRRGVKGELTFKGYVKLSESDRERLQEQAATLPRQPKAVKPYRTPRTKPLPTWRELMAQGYDKETALRIASDLKESDRLSAKDYSVAELEARAAESASAADKLKMDRADAELRASSAYIEERGGTIGVLTDAEAAKAERAYTTMKRYEVGEGQYDITAALQDKAFTAAELREMGFSQADVSDATERVSTSSFPETAGQKVSAKASTQPVAEPFKGSVAKGAIGQPDATSVKPSPSVAQAGIMSNVLILPFRNRDGSYNLQRMIESGLVSTKVMREAGFTDAQIMTAINAAMRASAVKGSQATVGGLTAFAGATATAGKGPDITFIDPNKATPTSTGVKAAATRNLLLRYQNKDASYDLQKAIEGGRVSVFMLEAAGFTDAQIVAAINAAMKYSAAAKSTKSGTLPEQTQQQRVDALAKVMGEIHTRIESDITAQQGKARDAERESERTSVALPGEERQWYHWPTGQTVSDAQYRKATDNGLSIKAEEYSLSVSSARRGAIDVVSAWLPVVRAALPEFDGSERTTMDWLVSAANMVALAAPFVPKVAGGVLQLGAGVILAGHTAKEWDTMPATGRALSAAFSVLLLTSGLHGLVQPSFKPVKVPLKDGSEAVVWSGLSVRGRPVVGITKLPPNIKNVAEGWRPITKTETSILGTRKMLAKMGVSEAEINKVLTTVKETKAFQPLRSPYEPKTVNVKDVAPKSLSPDELALVLREAQKNAKNVEMVYGSTTIKPQLAPQLRDWRKLGDIEIQLKAGVTEQQGAKLASDMVEALNQRTPGKFRIDPADPKRILVVGGHHAVELKLAEVSQLGVETQYSLSRTGEMSWGLKVGQKPITVNYPGVGKLDIMRLSESGVRKADAITRSASGGTFAPPAHRVKDIADYYVILRTFKGADVADEWAKLYGFDSAALLKAAAKDPLTLEAWRFSPKASPGAAPSVSISLPPSMAARVKASSPALYKTITAPVSSASLAASMSPVLSPSAASIATTSPTSPSAGSSQRISTRSGGSSPSIGTSPGSSSTGGSTGRSTGGSTGGSPGGSTGGGDTTITTTGGGGGGGGGGNTVPIGVVPYGGTGKEKKKEKKWRLGSGPNSDIDRDDTSGRVQWKQGAYWIMVEPPATEGEVHKNVQYSRRPFWGVRKVKGNPEQTFATQGKPPKRFLYEMGVTSIDIHTREKPHLRFRATGAGRRSRPRRGRIIR